MQSIISIILFTSNGKRNIYFGLGGMRFFDLARLDLIGAKSKCRSTIKWKILFLLTE